MDALGKSLTAHGIRPEGIDFVFITHWHRDHFGNLPLFKNAWIMTEAHAYECKFSGDRFGDYLKAVERIEVGSISPIRSGEEIIEGVRVVSTPGHTIDHASVLVSIDHGVVAIAGDAILDEASFHRKAVWKHNPDFFSETAASVSSRMLSEEARTIVPGHGNLFDV